MDKRIVEVGVIWMVLAVLFSSYIYLEPTITGLIVEGRQASYSDSLSLVLNESGEYAWIAENYGDMRSVKIGGSLENRGTAKVYIEDKDRRYLVFDSNLLAEGDIFDRITGLVVGEENETGVNMSETNVSEHIQNLTVLNETKSIDISLEYKAGSEYDVDDNGIETTTSVIDLGVEGSGFSWEVDESKVCTLWETYSLEEEESTIVCYGSEECCGFAGLMPSRESWNEVFYSYYGQYGATMNNIIYAQVYYYYLSLEDVEIYSSRKANLTAMYYLGAIKFDDVCVESCALFGFNSTSYKLVYEINDTILYLDSVDYSLIEEKITNTPPRPLNNISNITIIKNKNYSIDLSEYFFDDDGDVLSYSYYETENISVVINGSSATIVPDDGFTGSRYMFFKANDSLLTAVSNVFRVEVVEPAISEEVNKTRIVINRPIKWVKRVKFDKPGKVVINLTKEAKNISVKKIEDGIKFEVEKTKIKVNESGVVKDLDEYEKEKKTHDEVRELPTEKGIMSITGDVVGITGLVVAEETVNETNRTEIIINETVEEVEVEYYTKGPVSAEENISEYKKRIVISSDIHYEDVLAYTFLDREAGADAVKLHWLVNDSRIEVNIDKYDTNSNGLVDYIEWNVPSLSNQTYEVSITILNVQSYPTVGGNWEVRFETSGVGNLSIIGIDGTSYSEEADDIAGSEDDLTLLELRCGDNVLEPYYLVELDEGGNLITGGVVGVGRLLREGEGGVGLVSITGMVEGVNNIGEGIAVVSGNVAEYVKERFGSLAEVTGDVIDNAAGKNKFDIKTTKAIVDGRELSKEEIRRLRVSINKTKLDYSLIEKTMKILDFQASNKLDIPIKENQYQKSIENTEKNKEKIKEIEKGKGLMEITGNFIKSLIKGEEETIQIETTRVIIDGRELGIEEIRGLKNKTLFDSELNKDSIKNKEIIDLKNNQYTKSIEKELLNKQSIKEPPINKNPIIKLKNTDNQEPIEKIPIINLNNKNNKELKENSIITFFEIIPSAYAADGYRTVVVNGKEYALLTKAELEGHSYRVGGFYYEDYNCSDTGHHTVKVLTAGVHTQLFGFNGQNATADNTAQLNESGYELKLNIITGGGGAQENETGYKVKLEVSPDISGFTLNESSYKVTGNIYTGGVGGYYSESGYKFFLVPEGAFYSHSCEITPNDPACKPFIGDASATPSPQGYGRNVTIQANITAANGVNYTWVEITTPNNIITNFTMSNTAGTIYQYNYRNYTNGTYRYNIFANDSLGNAENRSGTFDIYVNMSIQVRTLKDIYTTNEFVNLTDPPGFSFDLSNLENNENEESIEKISLENNQYQNSIEKEPLNEKYNENEKQYEKTIKNSNNEESIIQPLLNNENSIKNNENLRFSSIQQVEYNKEPVVSEVSSSDSLFSRIASITVKEVLSHLLAYVYMFLLVSLILVFGVERRRSISSLIEDPKISGKMLILLIASLLIVPILYSFSGTGGDYQIEIGKVGYGAYNDSSNGYNISLNMVDQPVGKGNESSYNISLGYYYLLETTVPSTSKFDGATTNFANAADLSSVCNAVLERSLFGKIEWNDCVNVDGMDLNSHININNNYISMDAANLHSSLDSSANLSFYNLSLGYPKILKDGVECLDCSVLSWDTNSGNVVFNVSGFSNYTAIEANQSKIQNNGTTNASVFVLMKVQYFDSSSNEWVDDGVVHNSSVEVEINNTPDSGNVIKLDSYFNGRWNVSANASYGDGTYRVFAALVDNNWETLINVDGTILNASYNFTIDTTPDVSSVSATPSPQGYGRNVTIQASITHIAAIESAWVEITNSNDEANNFTMSNTAGDVYQYKYKNYTNGTYSYKIFTNDTFGNIRNSSTDTFDIYVNMTIQVRTLKDIYTTNEFVNLTDPPGFSFDLSSLENNENEESIEKISLENNQYQNSIEKEPLNEKYNENEKQYEKTIKNSNNEESIEKISLNRNLIDNNKESAVGVRSTGSLFSRIASITVKEVLSHLLAYVYMFLLVSLILVFGVERRRSISSLIEDPKISGKMLILLIASLLIVPILYSFTGTDGSYTVEFGRAGYGARNATDGSYDVTYNLVDQPVGKRNISGYNLSLGYYYLLETTVPSTSKFDGETTDFANAADLNHVCNAVLERTSYGKIEWLDCVNVDGQDLNSHINISNNYISLDVANLHSSLNSSANLSFYNLSLGYPKILKDGKECSDCSVLSWDTNNGNVVFNATGFSNYTAIEANQSKIQNNGTTNASVFVLMKVQYFDTTQSDWVDDGIVHNSSVEVEVNNTPDSGNVIKLDSYFNGRWNVSANASYGDGTYRVFAALVDNNWETLINVDGVILNASYNFSIDTTAPDTCSCPTTGDWTIACADNCTISSDCDMQGNSVSVSGDGTLTINAMMHNFDQFAVHNPTCTVACIKAEGCFG